MLPGTSKSVPKQYKTRKGGPMFGSNQQGRRNSVSIIDGPVFGSVCAEEWSDAIEQGAKFIHELIGVPNIRNRQHATKNTR